MITKKTKIRKLIKIGIIYFLAALLLSAFVFMRYLFMVSSGQALSIEQLKEERKKEKKNKKIIVIDKDSIIISRDSIIIELKTENEKLKLLDKT